MHEIENGLVKAFFHYTRPRYTLDYSDYRLISLIMCRGHRDYVET